MEIKYRNRVSEDGYDDFLDYEGIDKFRQGYHEGLKRGITLGEELVELLEPIIECGLLDDCIPETVDKMQWLIKEIKDLSYGR